MLPPVVTGNFWKAITELRNDKTRIVLPADKGRCAVVIDKEQYLEKANNMLADNNTYQLLKKDPTSSVKIKLVSLLHNLKKEGLLDGRTYKFLYPTAERPPMFYGLPKINKSNCPLRPIVYSIGSVTYNLAKWVNDIIKPLVGNTDRHIKNTQDFVQKVKDLKLEPGEVMVSFDVTALFTCVPTQSACEVIEECLLGDPSLHDCTNLSPNQIAELLKFCLDQTYFVFQEKYYRQTHGTAMGSPVSPTVAKVYMEHFESKALQTALHPPRVLFRYVDDTFTVLKEE